MEEEEIQRRVQEEVQRRLAGLQQQSDEQVELRVKKVRKSFTEALKQAQKKYPDKTLDRTALGDYHSHCIGKGGFGVVYKGKLHGFMDVAVKEILETRRGSNKTKNSFKKELSILREFPNPYLVQLLGWDVEQFD
jgi:hypothetical protein